MIKEKQYEYVDNPFIIPTRLNIQPKKVCICGDTINGDYYIMPDGTKVHDERECKDLYLLRECGAEKVSV